VHGVTLAFGFTLIGVAQDYPLHLLSHLKQDTTPTTTVRRLWPTLLTGVASTSIACLAFWWSGVDGLKQLALFTITGLWVASAVTRFVLPDWVGNVTVLSAHRWLDAAMLPGPRFALCRGILVLLAFGTALWLVIGPGIRFENDLARLSPLPQAWLERDVELRRAFGSPDMRHVLYVDALTAEQALTALEALDDDLETLVDQGAIEGFDHLARWIPAESTQRARQMRLPSPDAAESLLEQAMADTAFVADAFDPFLDDLEAARTMAPIRPSDLDGTPLALKRDSMLVPKGDDVAALITLRGHIDPARLAAFAAKTPGVHAIDLKAASERMVARYRDRIIDSLLVAGLLLVAVIMVSLRSISRAVRVLLPMTLSIVMVLGALTALGASLSLFHLIALILAAGLGIDYALFFEAAAHEADADPHAARHALVACAASTLLVFGLLATSGLPVLRALGVTVSLGVVFNFMFARFLLQSPSTRGSPPT